MSREKAKRRMASPEKLKLRAQRKARGIIRDRLNEKVRNIPK